MWVLIIYQQTLGFIIYLFSNYYQFKIGDWKACQNCRMIMQDRSLLVAKILCDIQSRHIGNQRKPSHN